MKNIFKLCASVLFTTALTFSISAAVMAEGPVQPVTTGFGIVTVDSYLNVRSEPNTDCTVIGKFVENDLVYVTDLVDGWCQIAIGDTKAYISSQYVANITEEEANALASAQAEKAETASSKSATVIDTAKAYIGVPYVYGGSSPKGFDCSGLMQYVFGKNGVSLPRTATAQYSAGVRISRGNLQPGDLVFFGSKRIEHVGVYVGDGNFLHSPSPGKYVRIESMTSGYYNRNYYGATRVLN